MHGERLRKVAAALHLSLMGSVCRCYPAPARPTPRDVRGHSASVGLPAVPVPRNNHPTADSIALRGQLATIPGSPGLVPVNR
jgi:hypothetical protein